MKTFSICLPLMLLSFLIGVISTKDIPMDGYPEKPSNTYLVVSNLAQRMVDTWRPKKNVEVTLTWPTNMVTWGSYTITNSTNVFLVWYSDTNITYTNGTIYINNWQ